MYSPKKDYIDDSKDILAEIQELKKHISHHSVHLRPGSQTKNTPQQRFMDARCTAEHGSGFPW